MSIETIKARLADVPGIENLTSNILLGRQVFGFNGLIAGVDMNATDPEIEDAIRATAALALNRVSQATPLPIVNVTETAPAMTTAPAGSFAANLRAMVDEARAEVAQARTDGIAKVVEAIGKMKEATAATAKVSGTMARTIEDEAASVLAELGQISNDLGA